MKTSRGLQLEEEARQNIITITKVYRDHRISFVSSACVTLWHEAVVCVSLVVYSLPKAVRHICVKHCCSFLQWRNLLEFLDGVPNSSSAFV